MPMMLKVASIEITPLLPNETKDCDGVWIPIVNVT